MIGNPNWLKKFVRVVTGGGGGGGDINTGLTHHWKFDENTGTTAADSVGGITGTFHDAGVTTWAAAKIGVAAVAQSGGGAGLTLASTITTGTTFTVAAWVFSTNANVSTYQAIFSQDGNHAVYILGQGSGLLKINFYNGGDHVTTSTFTANAWHHIAVSVSSGVATFYIDGVADASTYSSAPSLGIVGLGSDNGTGSEPLFGSMDDLVIYSRALSAADVLSLFNSTTGPTP